MIHSPALSDPSPIVSPWLARLWGEDLGRRPLLQGVVLVAVLFLVTDLLRAAALWAGGQPLDLWWITLAYDLTVSTLGYGLIRSGWSARVTDPGLGMPLLALGCGSILLSSWLLEGSHAMALGLLSTLVIVASWRVPVRPLIAAAVVTTALLALEVLGRAWWGDHGVTPAQWLPLAVAPLVLPVLAWAAQSMRRLQGAQQAQAAALAQARQTLESLSTRDALSGLSTHHHMLGLLEAECKRHSRSGRPFCIALVDIDKLARVNDTHGRSRGDEVIRQLASLSQAHLRASDVMARWGEDEFLLLLPDTDLLGGLRSMERWREHLFTRWGFYDQGRWQPMNSSIGITRYRAGESIHQTLQRAEQTLSSAKTQGGDRVVTAS